MNGKTFNKIGRTNGLPLLILLLPLTLGSCATGGKSEESKKDPAMVRDAKYCRSLAGLDQAGRNDPMAYRAQAHFNKCMKDRGWPGS